jgi:hypothetical protein
MTFTTNKINGRLQYLEEDLITTLDDDEIAQGNLAKQFETKLRREMLEKIKRKEVSKIREEYGDDAAEMLKKMIKHCVI